MAAWRPIQAWPLWMAHLLLEATLKLRWKRASAAPSHLRSRFSGPVYSVIIKTIVSPSLTLPPRSSMSLQEFNNKMCSVVRARVMLRYMRCNFRSALWRAVLIGEIKGIEFHYSDIWSPPQYLVLCLHEVWCGVISNHAALQTESNFRFLVLSNVVFISLKHHPYSVPFSHILSLEVKNSLSDIIHLRENAATLLMECFGVNLSSGPLDSNLYKQLSNYRYIYVY